MAEQESAREAFRTFEKSFSNLASASEIVIQADKSGIAEDAVSVVTADAVCYIPLAELVDFEKEKARLLKEKERLSKELERSNNMLNNENFTSKAPAAKIQAEKEKLEKYQQMMQQVEERLASFQ